MHTAWVTAVVFTVLNAALLTVRIRGEERALRTRERRLPMTTTVDLLVVGGGPVGLATPWCATHAGCGTVVPNRARVPSTRRAAKG